MFFLRFGVAVADSHNTFIEENEGSSAWFAPACVQQLPVPGSTTNDLLTERLRWDQWLSAQEPRDVCTCVCLRPFALSLTQNLYYDRSGSLQARLTEGMPPFSLPVSLP